MHGRPERVNVVLFDVGGVFVTERPDATHIAGLLGMDVTHADTCEIVDHAMWSHRDSYDAGCSDREFWDTVAGDCGLGEVPEEVLKALVAADVTRSNRPHLEAIALAHDLKDQGYTLGLLSNSPTSIATHLQSSQWVQELFEVFTFSSRVGHRKPSLAIYRAALDALSVAPDGILFIDDRQANLRSAQLVGMSTMEWKGAEAARAELEEIGVLPRRVAS